MEDMEIQFLSRMKKELYNVQDLTSSFTKANLVNKQVLLSKISVVRNAFINMKTT